MNLKRKMRKGFTLVELVVVIAVIAVLAAVSVGAYFGVTDSANSSNATAAQKQVKDIWLLYSVNEYDPNNSDAETGDDFCNDYIPYNGFTTYVNYKVVKFYDNPSYQAENQETIKRDGILFKIETDYPTWILVEDDRIVSESTVLKNENDFTTSLTSGKYIIEGCGSLDDFVLTTLVDSEGNEVRGTPYIKYDVNSDGSGSFVTTSYYGHPNESLFDVNGSFNEDLTTGLVNKGDLQLSELPLWTMEEKVSDNEYKPYATTTKHETSNVIVEKIELDGYINSYVTKVVSLRQTWTKDTDVNFSIEEYPVILWNEDAGTFIGYKSMDELSGQYSTQDGPKDNLPTSEYTEGKYSTYNIIFAYGKNAELTSTLNIPEGYLVVVEFSEFENVNTPTTFINNYLSTLKNAESFNETDSDIVTVDTTGYGDAAKTAAKYGSDYVRYNGYDIDPATGSHRAGFFNYLDTEEDDFDPATGKVNKHTAQTNPWTKEVNTLTIKPTATLNISSGSHLFVEGIVAAPSGSFPGMGILEHGAVYVEGNETNTGKIVLNYNNDTNTKTSYVRTLGKLYGEGQVIANDNTVVVDLFKTNTFQGGSITYMHSNAKVFPFYSYTMNNIQTNIVFNTGSYYKLLSVVFANDKNNYMPAFNAIAPLDVSQSVSSLFYMDENSQLTQGFDNNKTVFSFEKGAFEFGYLTMTLENLGTAIPAQTISSLDYQFPICNLDLIVESEATLNINASAGKSSQLVIMPSSSVVNRGTINILDGNEVAFMNFDEASYTSFLNILNTPKDSVKNEVTKKTRVPIFGEQPYLTYNEVQYFDINLNLINVINYCKQNFNNYLLENYGSLYVDDNSKINSINKLMNFSDESNFGIYTDRDFGDFIYKFVQYNDRFDAETTWIAGEKILNMIGIDIKSFMDTVVEALNNLSNRKSHTSTLPVPSATFASFN